MKHSEAAKSKLPYRPALFRRGLALVVIPIVVGTCVTLFLHHLWQTAEKAVKDEQEQSIFVGHLNVIFDHWADMSTCLLARTMESDPSFDRRILRDKAFMQREFAELRNAKSSVQTGRQERLARLKELWQQELVLFSTLSQASSNTDQAELLGKIQQMPRIFSKSFVIRNEVKKLLLEEAQELSAFRKEEAASRYALKRVAYGAAAGNIVLAILLVILLSRSINKRMRILTENATKLPRGEALVRHVPGNDELAYLDRVISEAGQRLTEAAAHRRSIFGMVAHDMRSPLMAAQTSLQMIIELDSSKIPSGIGELEAAESCLSEILGDVQALLSVEKTGAESNTDNSSTVEESALKVSGKYTALKPPSEVDVTAKTSNLKHPLLHAVADLVLRPRLFHQLLLLVLAPMVVQIIFLFWMNQQIPKMEELADRARRYSDMQIYGRAAQMDLVKTIAAKGVFLITGQENKRELSLKTYKQATEEFAKVVSLCTDDPEWKEAVDQVHESLFHRVDEILKLSRSDSPSTIADVLNRTGEIKSNVPQVESLRQRARLIYTRDRVKLQEMQLEQLEVDEHFSDIFLWSFAGNLSMAVGVLSLFTRNLNRRLQIVVDNAGRLGRRENLQRFVTGTDEIAFLDLILHQAKSQLDALAQQRADIMAALADHMRHPLQEAEVHLQRVDASMLGERSQNHLSRSHSNIERVLNLADDLLTMETLETGKVDLEKSRCDVSQIADEALATVASLARKKSIELKNNCKPFELIADRARIIQVLINYLANAIKFSAADTCIIVSSEEKGSVLRVSVIDQGPGMDAETRARVFEKFFQAATAEKKQGFGLGLAICSLIIESHGGHLGVESEPGKGSTFWFELPCNPER